MVALNKTYQKTLTPDSALLGSALIIENKDIQCFFPPSVRNLSMKVRQFLASVKLRSPFVQGSRNLRRYGNVSAHTSTILYDNTRRSIKRTTAF
jgi:hypothetical protein